MARFVLIGRNGQVGWELERSLMGLGETVALGRADLDLADPARVRQTVASFAPDFIVNAAAFTDVDGAEAHSSEAFAINATAVAALTEAALRGHAVLVHYSTDYVFDGTQRTPYRESDPPAPLNAYGRSKLAGEQVLPAAGCPFLLIRTGWVYATRSRNFPRTMLRLGAERPRLQVVNDQVGAPTSARFIAQATALMIRSVLRETLARERVAAGATVHVAAAGETTWFGVASLLRDLARARGLPFTAELEPIAAADYPSKTRRPAYSRLSLDVLEREWGITPPDWQVGLRQFVDDLSTGAAPTRAAAGR